MQHQFKSNKLQLKVSSDRNPDGINRTFSNIMESPSDDQITMFIEGIKLLTGETVQGITLTTAESIAND